MSDSIMLSSSTLSELGSSPDMSNSMFLQRHSRTVTDEANKLLASLKDIQTPEGIAQATEFLGEDIMGARNTSVKMKALLVYMRTKKVPEARVQALMHLHFHSGLEPKFFAMEDASDDDILALGDTVDEWCRLQKAAKYLRLVEWEEMKKMVPNPGDLSRVEFVRLLKTFMDVYQAKAGVTVWNRQHLKEIIELFVTARGVNRKRTTLPADGISGHKDVPAKRTKTTPTQCQDNFEKCVGVKTAGDERMTTDIEFDFNGRYARAISKLEEANKAVTQHQKVWENLSNASRQAKDEFHSSQSTAFRALIMTTEHIRTHNAQDWDTETVNALLTRVDKFTNALQEAARAFPNDDDEMRAKAKLQEVRSMQAELKKKLDGVKKLFENL